MISISTIPGAEVEIYYAPPEPRVGYSGILEIERVERDGVDITDTITPAEMDDIYEELAEMRGRGEE